MPLNQYQNTHQIHQDLIENQRQQLVLRQISPVDAEPVRVRFPKLAAIEQSPMVEVSVQSDD